MKSTYTGPATVFRHDKNGHTFYSVAVSRKNSEGDTIFGYKLVQFKKGVELADRTKIDIRNGWETFYVNKDGETIFYVFIADFTLQQGSAVGYQPQPTQYGQPQQYVPQQGYTPQQYMPPQQTMAYPQNVVPQQFGMAPQYGRTPEQLQQASQAAAAATAMNRQPEPPEPQPDDFEQIDEEVPF